jgi:TFIIH basal transcription factor complex TTD-A subunit
LRLHFCSDAAVKQILLQMNERRREENSFVIEDLDQTHLLIKADEEESMRQELEAEVCFSLLSLQSPEVMVSIFYSWRRIHTAWSRSYEGGVRSRVTSCSTCSALRPSNSTFFSIPLSFEAEMG